MDKSKVLAFVQLLLMAGGGSVVPRKMVSAASCPTAKSINSPPFQAYQAKMKFEIYQVLHALGVDPEHYTCENCTS